MCNIWCLKHRLPWNSKSLSVFIIQNVLSGVRMIALVWTKLFSLHPPSHCVVPQKCTKMPFLMDIFGCRGIHDAVGWNNLVALADLTIMSLIMKGRKPKSSDVPPCWSEHVSFERGEIRHKCGIIYETWGPPDMFTTSEDLYVLLEGLKQTTFTRQPPL